MWTVEEIEGHISEFWQLELSSTRSWNKYYENSPGDQRAAVRPEVEIEGVLNGKKEVINLQELLDFLDKFEDGELMGHKLNIHLPGQKQAVGDACEVKRLLRQVTPPDNGEEVLPPSSWLSS